MTDLVPVTFLVWSTPLDGYRAERCDMTTGDLVAEKFATRWGGVAVTAEPTDVEGEFRVSGLFPRGFAEARSYDENVGLSKV